MSGRAGVTGKEYLASTAAFEAALPARLAALYGSGRNRSCSGSHSSVSMPLRMPTRSSRRARRIPSKPNPNSGDLNLGGVARADGRDRPRVVDAALHEADVAPEFQPIDAELLPAQVEPRQPVGGKHTLIREIVNREDARCAAQHGMRGVQRLQVDRRKPRLPVVRVDHRGRHAAPRGQLERRTHQHREAQGVVRVFRAVDAVQSLPIEQLRAVDEQRGGAVPHPGFEEPDLPDVPAHRHREALDERPGGDSAVSRQRERHVPTEPRQRRRQRPEHVAQAAGLGERDRFRTDDEH